MARDSLEIQELTKEKINLPLFQPKWWHLKKRLDARPIIWSLEHNPQDWRWNPSPSYSVVPFLTILEHVPSGHSFWIGNELGLWRLGNVDCSCSSFARKFQPFQTWSLTKAYKKWKKTYGYEKYILLYKNILRKEKEARERANQKIRNQFASHFIGPAKHQ